MKKSHSTRKNTLHKYTKLIDISKGELLNKGISQFNYERVILFSGLSKTTVYKKFGKKEDFIIFLIKSILDDFYVSFKEYVHKFTSFKEVIDFVSHLNFDIETILKDYPIDDFFQHSEITSYVNNYYYLTFGNVIIDKIKEFQKKGEVRNDIEAKYILEFLTSVTKGMGMMLKDHDSKDVLKNYTKLIESALSVKYE
ncbi:TetR/AcrR family transcriptional regulator [Petrotoga sp. 9PWA.NaAc.5.4]|uniref:TetR/AcrR family transcriptional regulator n=1 Tax=Petrotoga sp. 9PWA.NaAc.5.4 TaxID=1434328 RepID=UPI000CAEE8DE|nr:TetR/AcrR family transcriptional regulator [Petrotoga sp. 9PWA.NaAc.5.4]PNR92859.1 hypothetical protein X924_08755 [Petrotoga sp. 9PWA.NaAc.5.4]